MNSLKFSIIIPCFNVEKYISKTIESVLSQTYNNFELILINDGSTDETKNIIERYKKIDKRVKIINKNNEGVSKTRNLGIRISKGKYLYFLDGDDCIEKNLLEEASLIFQNKEVDMFSFGYDTKNKFKLKIYNNKKYNEEIFNSKEFLKHFLKRGIFQSMCSFIIKKEFIGDLNFNDKLITGEDLDFQMRLLLENNFKVFYSSNVYFHYLIRENSASTKKIVKFKNLRTLDSLDILRKKMLENNIKEFDKYYIIRFFNIIRGLAVLGFNKNEYNIIKNKLEKYDYIFDELKIEFNKEGIILYFLKLCYIIHLRLIFFIFKLENKIF